MLQLVLTTDDEDEAKDFASNLRKAMVVEVRNMHMMNLPAPRTTDRWAVLKDGRSKDHS